MKDLKVVVYKLANGLFETGVATARESTRTRNDFRYQESGVKERLREENRRLKKEMAKIVSSYNEMLTSRQDELLKIQTQLENSSNISSPGSSLFESCERCSGEANRFQNYYKEKAIRRSKENPPAPHEKYISLISNLFKLPPKASPAQSTALFQGGSSPKLRVYLFRIADP